MILTETIFIFKVKESIRILEFMIVPTTYLKNIIKKCQYLKHFYIEI